VPALRFGILAESRRTERARSFQRRVQSPRFVPVGRTTGAYELIVLASFDSDSDAFEFHVSQVEQGIGIEESQSTHALPVLEQRHHLPRRPHRPCPGAGRHARQTPRELWERSRVEAAQPDPPTPSTCRATGAWAVRRPVHDKRSANPMGAAARTWSSSGLSSTQSTLATNGIVLGRWSTTDPEVSSNRVTDLRFPLGD
jgi:hypothetical protein